MNEILRCCRLRLESNIWLKRKCLLPLVVVVRIVLRIVKQRKRRVVVYIIQCGMMLQGLCGLQNQCDDDDNAEHQRQETAVVVAILRGEKNSNSLMYILFIYYREFHYIVSFYMCIYLSIKYLSNVYPL
jgi:hypothetical protein